MLKLHDWININKINWDLLFVSENTLKNNQNNIDWEFIFVNKNKINLLFGQ